MTRKTKQNNDMKKKLKFKILRRVGSNHFIKQLSPILPPTIHVCKRDGNF